MSDARFRPCGCADSAAPAKQHLSGPGRSQVGWLGLGGGAARLSSPGGGLQLKKKERKRAHCTMAATLLQSR